jgi:Carboxypeptidase regulatory-like domain
MARIFKTIVVCLGLTALACAQQTPAPGTLSGTLNGINGSKNVVLILANVNTGAAQRVTPDSNGAFSVALPPGTYRVEVERDGFRQTAQQDVTITGGQPSQLNVTIQGGPTIEAVEVNAQAPASQTTPPEVGTGYTSSTVRTLPVFDRNYQELEGLMTGVTPPATTVPLSFDPQMNRQFNTNGLPVFTNDQLSDGISIREPLTNELAIRILPEEAIQQLNVIADSYPVNQGFASGTISNVYPRPGTNGVHGSLFGFVTDNFFKTHDSFNISPNPEPTLHNREFGGTVGGPLSRDRLFWFMSYQGNIADGSTTQFATVPTYAELAGNFSAAGVPIYNPATGVVTGINAGLSRFAFPGGIIPATLFNPVALTYLSFLPATNLTGTANNLEQNVRYGDRSNVADGRLDYHFTNNLSGFLRYGWSGYNANEGSIFGSALGGDTLGTLRNHEAAASLVGNVHGFITEFRVGYTRYRNAILPGNVNPALSTALAGVGFGTGGTDVPNVAIEGLGVLGTPTNVPARDVDNNYEGSATIHWYHGRNQFYFGAEVRDLWSVGFPNFQFSTAGSFFFTPGPTSYPGATINPGTAFASSLASFLLGAPTETGIFNSITPPSYHERQYAGFVGDQIRMNRLTIDLGVRYEIFSPVTVKGINGETAYNFVNNTSTFGNSVGRYDYGFGAVQPRIGFAFRLANQTVIRTSYSINSFPLPFGLLPINITGVGISGGVVGSYAASTFGVPAVNGLSNAGPTASNIPYYINGLTRNPYVENYYFMIQHSAPLGFLLSAGYVGNVARDMPFIRPINVAAPGTGVAGLPFASLGQTAPVYFEGNGLTSNYNSLQVNLTKRMAESVAFSVAYTYSKAMDYGTYIQNPFSLSANYGPADWDHQQMLTISHVFDLPFGQGTNRWNQGLAAKILGNWKLIGLSHWATGSPYNLYADSLGCDCPGVANTFASVSSGTSVNGNASFNPSSFVLPTAGTFGNLGRNSVRGPNFTNYNLSLFKSFPMAENRILELRAEAYNLLNSTQNGAPYNNLSLGTFGTAAPLSGFSGLFGGEGRTFVLGARLLF